MIDIPLPGCVWVILATLGAGCGDPAPAVRDAVDDGADAPFGMPVIPQSSDFCGVDSAAGVYRGPCNLVVQGTQVSTLCDEATHTCVAPHADCADGWCRIPAASYLSGLGPDWGGFSVDSEDAAMTIVPRTYAIQATEVTVDDFVKVMGYTPPGAVNCSDCPVTNVSIFEALSYANRMSDAMGLNECYTLEGCSFELVDGSQAWTCVGASFAGPECDGIRLPSRAEWELASRGGGVMCFPDGSARADGCVPPEADDPARVARFCGNAVADYKPCPFDFSPEGPVCAGPSRVAGLPPNPFGLYDTNGNVVEYTQTEWVPLGRSATWIVERVDAKPEFIFDIDMDSSLADMGNHYFANARATCAYVEGPGAAVPPPEYRVQGFRLARTLAYSASADP